MSPLGSNPSAVRVDHLGESLNEAMQVIEIWTVLLIQCIPLLFGPHPMPCDEEKHPNKHALSNRPRRTNDATLTPVYR